MTTPPPPPPAGAPADIRPRVVVTGHDPDGKSVVVEDSTATPIANPGLTDYYAVLWGIDELPRFPDDGARPPIKAVSPGVGAARFVQMILPPAGQQPLTTGTGQQGRRETMLTVPGAAPGVHFTASVDFLVVIEGEVWLELTDGVEVHLRPGDSVVQNGTAHAWRNHGTVTARVGVVAIGTPHSAAPAR
jgi:mannose-6-phosphate isomerase-like protein (cupin superfamily)